MASLTTLLSEEQFLCSICLDVFTHPVSTPCGHNYCKACITQHWNGSDLYKCPMCNKLFNTRPELQVNTLLSEMTDQFRSSVSVTDQPCAKPGEVPCDFCTGTKTKAVKSCLVCVMSYCQTHLEPHHRVLRLKIHQLIDPVENLEDRMCKKHDKPLEMFCKTDQVCVCQSCCLSDHKNHLVVPLKEEGWRRKTQLGQTEAEVHQMIQERRLKIQQIQHSVKLSKGYADRQISEGVKVFTALMHSIEESQAELISTIQDQHKSTERQAEDFIKDLEEELTELTERSSELEKLSHTEDHLHLLQSLPSLITPPHTKDWTKVHVQQPSYVGTVGRALDQLEKTLSMEIKKQCEAYELKKVQQDAVDVTLDPDTAHPALVLSEDGKQVYTGLIKRNLPDNPERFSKCTIILGKQSFSSGRFYYEVEVKGKPRWDLGVARKSIDRKGEVILFPENGFWTIFLRNDVYYIHTVPAVRLSVRGELQKLGVFVDYEEGLVSFYDVENRVHIYSFTGCTFTEPLCPFFSPSPNHDGKNSSPLIINTVNDRNSMEEPPSFNTTLYHLCFFPSK